MVNVADGDLVYLDQVWVMAGQSVPQTVHCEADGVPDI